MQLSVAALLAWSMIIVFSVVPKRLQLLDLLFLYGVVLVTTTTLYSVFDVNMHVVTIPRQPEISFAAIITRIITIPLGILLAVDVLHFTGDRGPRWLTAVLIWLGLCAFDLALNLLHIITYQRSWLWHISTTLIYYLGFILISWGFVWMYRRFDDGRLRQVE